MFQSTAHVVCTICEIRDEIQLDTFQGYLTYGDTKGWVFKLYQGWYCPRHTGVPVLV